MPEDEIMVPITPKIKVPICNAIIGTIYATIDIWYLSDVEDRLNFYSKGGLGVSDISSISDTKTLTCTGTAEMPVKSKGFIQRLMWDTFGVKPWETYPQPEPGEVRVYPLEPRELKEAIDYKGIKEFFDRINNIKSGVLEKVRKDKLMVDLHIYVLDFSLDKVEIIPKDRKWTEAEIWATITAQSEFRTPPHQQPSASVLREKESCYMAVKAALQTLEQYCR